MTKFLALVGCALAWSICVIALSACAGSRPDEVGTATPLAPCPASPNCVSSRAADAEHAVAPYELAIPPLEAWPLIRSAVAELPRTRIVSDSPTALHAECRSALIGYVDDLELRLLAAAQVVEVRSASRVGYGDMGVNRERVEALRQRLRREGIVR